MATKNTKWSDVPAENFHQLIDLVSDAALDRVFYPVPEEKPGMGLFGNLARHYSHPLHANFKPPMQLVGGGLLSGGPGDPLRFEPQVIDYDGERARQTGRITEHWQAIKSNKIFQLLNADANFQKAMAVFKRKREAAKEGNLYAHAFAEFRFLEAVASNVWPFLFTGGEAFNWPIPDKKAIGKARGHAWAMLDAFDKDGVKLADHAKHYSLKASLSELADQLDVQYKSGRAAWGGKNRPYRVFIETLANSLRRHFGEVSPEIVLSLAAMVGCPFSDRTINNQLNSSREKHRQTLAKALLSSGKNSSKTG